VLPDSSSISDHLYQAKGNLMAEASTKKNDSSVNIGFETKFWLASDKLRNNMDAAEYKHVVLGLIFLKYASDAFDEHRAKLVADKGDYAGADPEDQDEYKAEFVESHGRDCNGMQLALAA
jgi:type I restriction enzyme M protein